MAFHFVAERAVGQRDAGGEGAQRGRKADQRHQSGDADHQRQRENGKHLVQPVFADKAEHGRHQITHADHNHRHCAGTYQRVDPAGLGGEPVGKLVAVVPAAGTAFARKRQQRHQRHHRNRRHVLKQQHRKARLAAGRANQVFLGEGLQHDGGGGNRQNAADGHAGLPRFVKGHGDAGNRRHRQQHLQPAQAQKLVPQLPEHRRRQLEADEKHHHHHAELGNMLDAFRFFADKTEHRPDDDAGQQITQYRTQTQFLRNQYRPDGECEINKGVQQDVGHGAGSVAR